VRACQIFLLVTRGSRILLAGHTRFCQVNPTAGSRRHCLTSKTSHTPYTRRCPAPGLKARDMMCVHVRFRTLAKLATLGSARLGFDSSLDPNMMMHALWQLKASGEPPMLTLRPCTFTMRLPSSEPQHHHSHWYTVYSARGWTLQPATTYVRGLYITSPTSLHNLLHCARNDLMAVADRLRQPHAASGAASPLRQKLLVYMRYSMHVMT
jgi:hypothetical protein